MGWGTAKEVRSTESGPHRLQEEEGRRGKATAKERTRMFGEKAPENKNVRGNPDQREIHQRHDGCLKVHGETYGRSRSSGPLSLLAEFRKNDWARAGRDICRQ